MSDRPAPTNASLDPLRATLAAGRVAIRARHEGGASGHDVVRATADLVDRVVISLFEEVAARLGGEAGLTLAAIGGYGRRELSPRSDVDLLLVHGGDEPRARAASEGIFTPLWDLKLEVGAAVRTPEECEKLAAQEHTARTALLDCRFLAGDRALYGELERRVLRGLTQAQVDELVAAKAEELVRRRERFGGSVHLLEPNVKQSPGGLRDLQAALWISRARFKAAGLSDLLNRGVLPPREVERLKAARDLIWRVRNQLHYLADRREDHLTFDRQEQVAQALGYEQGTPAPGSAAPPHGLGVERFMRDYYLAADAIRRLADEIIDRCQAGNGPAPGHVPRGRTVAPGLKLWQGRLTLEGREALAVDPSLFVRLFTTAEELGVAIYPWARDLCREEAPRLDDAVRSDPRVTGALRAAFARCTKAEWVRQMHREGVLGALLPEFGRVTALHQHDMYHVYTVDTHLVFALQRLGALMGGELLDQEPLASHVAREVTRPLALALGVLFHDAGKGLGGDHSRKGAELVRSVCERLEVPEPEAADAEFLVAEHLVMSHTSQRRDLSDPELIASFSARMGDRRRLDMLFLLTYVDIASVGPQTWNEWKRRLLTELYEKSVAELERPAAPRPDTAHREALEARGFSSARIEPFLQRMPRRYFSFADPRESPRALRVLELGARRELTAVARALPASDMTLLTVCAEDRPGLLSAIAGVLTAHRINILGADVFSTTDGKALDFFVVRGPRGGGVERARIRAARRDLALVLRKPETLPALLARVLRPSPLPVRPAPPVPTRVKVDNVAARGFTVVDVFARDRPGLLHAVTDALHGQGLTISVARITTEGHKAIDAFYVTDEGGAKLTDPARLAALEALLVARVEALPLP